MKFQLSTASRFESYCQKKSENLGLSGRKTAAQRAMSQLATAVTPRCRYQNYTNR